MSKVKIQGNASGTGVITLTAPNTSTDRTVTLPDEDITLGGGVDGIVSTADATAITINSSEQVGIGKTPVNTLDVNHSGGAVVKLWRDSNSGYLQLDTDGTNSHIKNGGGPIKFKTGSDTVRASVTDNGICFGTDTAAANALDDYEEGTWTPNIYNTGHSAGAATTTGVYTKVGRLVTCFFRVDDGVTGGGTGALKIAGLPFAPSGMPGSGTLGFCVVRAGATGGSTGYRRGITYESGTEFNIMETTAADTAVYRYVSSGFSYLAAT